MNTPALSSVLTNSSNLAGAAELITAARTILVLQPEHPDTDSLCSALALEEILGDQGKTVILYSKGDLAPYLMRFSAADRLIDRFPSAFDLVLVLDMGGPSQMARTLEHHAAEITRRPVVLIDHHGAREPFSFPLLEIISPECAATGELLTRLADELGWTVNAPAANLLSAAISADTLGLTTKNTSADTVHTMARLVQAGADLHALNEARLAASALTPELIHLRGELLRSAEFSLDGRLVTLIVGPETLKTHAKAYDPAALVFFDLQHVTGVQAVAVVKDYGTKIKLSLRTNAPIAATVAEAFGGGGHLHAAAAGLPAGDAEALVERVRTVARASLETLTREADTGTLDQSTASTVE